MVFARSLRNEDLLVKYFSFNDLERFLDLLRLLSPRCRDGACLGSGREGDGARPVSRLTERVRHGDAEILLACIEIFRQDSLTASAFRRRDDHAVVEMDSVGRAG